MKNLFLIVILGWLFLRCDRISDPAPDNLPNLRVLSESEKEIIQSTNEFAFALLNHINKEDPDKNIFISPLSVAYALAMTGNGAAGSTRDSILYTLSLKLLSMEDINLSFKTLTGFLDSLDNTTRINIANSIWFDQDLHIQNDFSGLIQDFYRGKIQGLDFGDAGSKDIINLWIETETRGKIKNMIDEIPDAAVMFLVNAIYFKSPWTFRFDKEKTKPGDFFSGNGTVEQVDMMESEGVKVKYFADNSMQVIDIPYGNEQYAMAILMPSSIEINELAGSFTAQQFSNCIQKADTTTLKLTMPKFTMEYKAELKNELSGMGMAMAFGGGDFSNLFEEELPLTISSVLHQAKIEVNEEGTEAAAATVVTIELTSLPASPLHVIINRPFLFFIHERYSNTILFSGKMINPAR